MTSHARWDEKNIRALQYCLVEFLTPMLSTIPIASAALGVRKWKERRNWGKHHSSVTERPHSKYLSLVACLEEHSHKLRNVKCFKLPRDLKFTYQTIGCRLCAKRNMSFDRTDDSHPLNRSVKRDDNFLLCTQCSDWAACIMEKRVKVG